jgi:hypothetical protein
LCFVDNNLYGRSSPTTPGWRGGLIPKKRTSHREICEKEAKRSPPSANQKGFQTRGCNEASSAVCACALAPPPRLRTTPNPMTEILIQIDLGYDFFFISIPPIPNWPTQTFRLSPINLSYYYNMSQVCSTLVSYARSPLGADISCDDMMMIDRR